MAIDPITMGAISGGLNLLGGLGQKSSNIAAANAAYESKIAFGERDYAININDLKIAAQEVNNELGMALTELIGQQRNAAADTAVTTTERNVYGNTAGRQQRMVEMKAELQKDRLAQAAESSMIDVQNSMRSEKYARESRIADAAQQRSNVIAQQPSTLGLLAGAASAGINGYSQGLGMQSAKNQTVLQGQLSQIQKARLEMAKVDARRYGIAGY